MSDSTFGDKLRELRKAKGLTQQQLADATGLSQNAISHWEADDREPGWSAVQALAVALGVDCTSFTEGKPAPKKGGKKK